MQVGSLLALGTIAQNATTSLQLAKGTTAQRPAGASGKVRYNSDLERYEFFLGGATSAWANIGLGDGSVTSITLASSSTGLSIANATVTNSGTISINLAGEIAALNALSATGFVARTGTAAYAPRAITPDAGAGKQGLSVTNGDGVSGNPTLGLSISSLTAATAPAASDQILAFNGTNNVRMTLSQVATAIGGSFGKVYRMAFTQATLTSGILTVTHGLGQQFNGVTVVDNNNKQIQPDEVTYTSASALAVDLTSFGALTGTWNVVVVG